MMLPLCLSMALIILLITSLIPQESNPGVFLDHLPPPKPNHCVVPESKILNRMWSLSAEQAVTWSQFHLRGACPAHCLLCLKVLRCGKSNTALDSGEG